MGGLPRRVLERAPADTSPALPQAFFARPVTEVARDLLGCELVHRGRSGIIVETEAYGGPEDLASHARFGVTARNAVMFGPAGISYVYLCYGMYDLFNVVTGREGKAEAVLIRALAPGRGLGGATAIARGPGKLTRALGISRKESGRDLTRGAPLFIRRTRQFADRTVATGPRIGVDYAGRWAREPLRFWIKDHPSVSGTRR